MEPETQEEKQEPARGRVPNWMVNALLSAISAVSLWLVHSYSNQIDQLKADKAEMRKDNIELQIKLDTCTNHRFNEMIHGRDQDKRDLDEFREEQKHRFDSLINQK